MSEERTYLPGLRFHFLTPFYDLLSRLTREYYFKNRLIRMAGLGPDMHVLDVGCGTGTLALMAKTQHPEVTLTAIDCDEGILTIARDKADQKNLDINFRNAFSDDLPFADASLDSCFSTLFFHHLDREQKQKTLQEIFRSLNKNGQLLIADWGQPANFAMQVLSLQVRFFDGKVTEDNLNGLLPQLIESAGFNRVESVEHLSTIFGTITLIQAFKP